VSFFTSEKEQFKINMFYLTLDNPIIPLKERFTSLNYINFGYLMLLLVKFFRSDLVLNKKLQNENR
jgi:hypothetical protein